MNFRGFFSTVKIVIDGHFIVSGDHLGNITISTLSLLQIQVPRMSFDLPESSELLSLKS